MRPAIFKCVPRCLAWAVASLAASALWAQSPEVEPGQHEYVVWLVPRDEEGDLLPLTGAQQAKYCAVAQELARRIYDTTNGRHTIRKVTFFYDEAPPVGPYHVTWRRWHATASAGSGHISMYDEDLGCRSNWGTEDGAVVRLPGTCPEGLTCEDSPDRPRCRTAADETVPGTAVIWGWVFAHETGHANYYLRDEYLYPGGSPEDDYLHICNNPETNTSQMAHRDRDHWCDGDTHLHQRWILGYGSSVGDEDVQVTEPTLAGYDVWTDAQATWMDLTDYVLGEYDDDPAPAFVPADDLCVFTGALADATPANDTMVVVDKSGSMGFKNSDSPQEPTALETAFLAGLAHYNAIPLNDRNVGLLLFDTGVTEVLPYEPRTEAQTADLFTAAPGGLTDLCLAVSEGTARVRTSGATMPRGTVVLLTDGRPTVPACDDEEAVLAAVLDACLGDPPVDVWPVAFGDAEYVLMSRIAEACGTQALWIEKDAPGGQEDTFEIQAALLRQGFRARSYREVLFDRSPTVADHARTFAIPPGTAELEVAWVGEPFEWADPDVGFRCRFDQLAFELLDPDGIPQGVDPVPPASEATYFTRTRRVLRPAAGTWTMRATAGPNFFCLADNSSYQGYVPKLASLAQIRASTAFAEVEVSGPVVARNEALLVTAVLHGDAVTALTDIEVTAEVANDAGSTPVTLRDDGTGGDEVAGDGRYTGRFNDCGGAVAPGAYRVVVKLQADAATAASVVSPSFDYVLTGGAPEPGPAISATLREERAVVVAGCLSAEEAQRCGAPAPAPAARCPRPFLEPTTPGIELDPGETATDVEVCLAGVVLVERGVRVGLGPGVTASNVRVDYDPVADRTCILFDATADEDAPGGDIGITVTFGGEVYETEGGEPPIVVSGRGPAWSFHLGVADPRGDLAAEFGKGPSAALDYSLPIGSGLSWDLQLGWSRFEHEAAGDDLDVWDLAVNLALRRPLAGDWWWQIHGGPELFLVDGTDLEGGFDLGAGLGFDLQPSLSLEAAWSRHATVTGSPKVEFDSLRIGLLWSF